jgi:predicted PhzF superfamily epimerase YddE/YHI9
VFIDSFCSRAALGNRHQITCLTQPPRTAPDGTLAWAGQALPHHGNSIALWQQGRHWHARFFAQQQPVQRCGSGNIAVAAYLYHQVLRRPFACTLHTNAGTVTVGVDNQGAYYHDRPCSIGGLGNTRHWAYLCQQPVVKAVPIGNRQDYTLVVLPHTHALRHMRLRSRELALYSARSVIALAPARGFWGLRYFAPQYGVAEDAATGSACVQACHVLAKATPLNRMTFVQFSQAGGVIYAHYQSRRVTVRGHYRVVMP